MITFPLGLTVNEEDPTTKFSIDIDDIAYRTDADFLRSEAENIGSPAWWGQYLARKSADCTGYKTLNEYYLGQSKLPFVPREVQEAFQRFQKKARTNFAGLVITAAADRFSIKGFKTNASSVYDAAAWAAWESAGMEIVSKDVFANMLIFGEAYAVLGKKSDGSPYVTAETPLSMSVEYDEFGDVAAAAKMSAPDIYGVSRFYVYMPGAVYVFKSGDTKARFDSKKASFGKWNYSPEESVSTGLDYVNVVSFQNKDGLGEFEKHLDLIDRINEGILNRMIIMSTQAHRQRMIEQSYNETESGEIVDLPTHDEEGNEIDYTSMIPSSPGEVGILPPGAKIWESSQTDIQGHLNAVKQDILDLAAVTSTLIYYLFPDGSNVSSNSSEQGSEAFVFKMEDRIRRVKGGFTRIAEFIFDTVGIDYTNVSVAFGSLKQSSVQQQSVAYSQLSDLPIAAKLSLVFGLDPHEISEIEDQVAQAEIQAALKNAMASRTTSNESIPEIATVVTPGD